MPHTPASKQVSKLPDQESSTPHILSLFITMGHSADNIVDLTGDTPPTSPKRKTPTPDGGDDSDEHQYESCKRRKATPFAWPTTVDHATPPPTPSSAHGRVFASPNFSPAPFPSSSPSDKARLPTANSPIWSTPSFSPVPFSSAEARLPTASSPIWSTPSFSPLSFPANKATLPTASSPIWSSPSFSPPPIPDTDDDDNDDGDVSIKLEDDFEDLFCVWDFPEWKEWWTEQGDEEVVGEMVGEPVFVAPGEQPGMVQVLNGAGRESVYGEDGERWEEDSDEEA